jgi:peptidoglycan/LPS O-acetylase OafA/YrhL
MGRVEKTCQRTIGNIKKGARHPLRTLNQWFKLELEDNSKQKNTIRALDGVRAIACLTVIWFHVNLITRDTKTWNGGDKAHMLYNALALAGAAGVTLFFVLSGFLLFMPFVKALIFENKWPSTRQFYMRRALRILPGYYFSLILLILFSHPEYLQAGHLVDLGLFITLFMDAPRTFMQINGPYWSLAVEWQFYLILPWLALVFALIVRLVKNQVGRVWIVATCLLGVVAWGIFSRYWGAYYLQHQTQTVLVPRAIFHVLLFFLYGSSGKYLEDFAIGMLASLCYMLATTPASEGRPNPFAHVRVWLETLSPWLWDVGALGLIIMALWHYNLWYPGILPIFNPITPYFNTTHEAGLATFFGLCVLAILFGSKSLKRCFELPFLRWIGMISYSLYIWHFPLLLLFLYQVVNHIKTWNPWLVYGSFVVWIVFAIFPYSFLCYRFIEKPFMNLSHRPPREPKKNKNLPNIRQTAP